MNRKQVLAAVIGVGAVTTGAAAQDAVQWRVEDGGNGHWYSITPTAAIWSVVKAECESRGGHLVTITSAEENSFATPFAGSATAWIGAFQPPGSCEPLCDWRWVTGEPWGFSQWAPPGANDFGGIEDNAETYGSGQWNDMPNGGWSRRGIIEWSADCNADGIVDYGQILSGELEDTNSNGVPDCCDAGTSCACLADIDGNGDINGIDLAIILDKWGTNGGKDYPNADIDGDGTIAGADLAEVLGNWGACQ